MPLEEDAAAFAALQADLLAELAPVGAVQTVLAQRVVSAAWRLARADEIESGVLYQHRHSDGGLGLAAVRDGNGGRTLPTLPRYRNAALAEFLRCLRALEARQAETRAIEAPAGRRQAAAEPARPTPISARPMRGAPEPRHKPNEPEARANPGDSAPAAPPTLGLAPLPPPALRPGEPAPVLARLQRDVDEWLQAAERGGMRRLR